MINSVKFLFVFLFAVQNFGHANECSDFLLNSKTQTILEATKSRLLLHHHNRNRDYVFSEYHSNIKPESIASQRQVNIDTFSEAIDLRYTLGTDLDIEKGPLFGHTILLDKPTRELRSSSTRWTTGLLELRKKRLALISRNYTRRSWDEDFVSKVTKSITDDTYRSQSVIVFDKHEYGRTPNVPANSKAIGSVRLIYAPYIHLLVDNKEVLYPLPFKRTKVPTKILEKLGLGIENSELTQVKSKITWDDLNNAQFELLPVEEFFNTQIKRERLNPFTFQIQIDGVMYQASLSYITEVSSFSIERNLPEDERNMVLAELLYGLNRLMLSDPLFWGYENDFNYSGYYNTPQSQLFYQPNITQFFAYSDRAGRLMYNRMGFKSTKTSRTLNEEVWQMQESDGQFISHILRLRGGYTPSLLSRIFKTYEEDASVHLKYGMIYDFIIRYARQHGLEITAEELDLINSDYFKIKLNSSNQSNIEELKIKIAALDNILSSDNLIDLTGTKLFEEDQQWVEEEDLDNENILEGNENNDQQPMEISEPERKLIVQNTIKLLKEVVVGFERNIPKILDNLETTAISEQKLKKELIKSQKLYDNLSRLMFVLKRFSTQTNKDISSIEPNLYNEIKEWMNILETLILSLETKIEKN